MNLKQFFIGATIICIATFVMTASNAVAQSGFSIPVQLPTIQRFGINTVVSVPDGGTMYLGGTKSYSSGQNSRGSLGPFRPFANRSSGYNASSTGAAVKATIISTREMEEDLIAHGMYLRELKGEDDVNGSPEVQAKADFITRNIGRSKKRR